MQWHHGELDSQPANPDFTDDQILDYSKFSEKSKYVVNYHRADQLTEDEAEAKMTEEELQELTQKKTCYGATPHPVRIVYRF